MKQLIFASNNAHKLTEVKSILSPNFTIIGLKDLYFQEDLAEDGSSFEENALQKAKFIQDKYSVSCFAEDAGLEVFALNMDPGIYSARYAGPSRSDLNNNKLLLENLLGETDRRARFKAVIALCINNEHWFFEGVVNGTIALSPSGNNGFGYDPIFIPDDYNKSFAELGSDIKNTISHRAKALEKLREFLFQNKMP